MTSKQHTRHNYRGGGTYTQKYYYSLFFCRAEIIVLLHHYVQCNNKHGRPDTHYSSRELGQKDTANRIVVGI